MWHGRSTSRSSSGYEIRDSGVFAGRLHDLHERMAGWVKGLSRGGDSRGGVAPKPVIGPQPLDQRGALAPSATSAQEVVEDGDDARYCDRMRRNSWRTDSGRPHIWTLSARPARVSRSAISPAIPVSSSARSEVRTAPTEAA